MTTRKHDRRKLIQLTMRPDLYNQIKDHCQSLDMPITIWARELIMRELQSRDDHDLMA